MFLIIGLVSLGLTIWILHRHRTWVEPGQRAIVVIHPSTGEVTTPLTAVVWQPQTQSLLLLPLPDELLFRASHNGELYPTNGLPRLAEIEQWSEARWRRELSLQLGIVFDATLYAELPQEGFGVNELRHESWSALVGRRTSSLAVWDRLTWWQYTQNADPLKSQVFAFESSWLDPQKLLNQSVYDRFARLRLQDEAIRTSQWTLRVVNASGISGDASRQARMLELIGYGVRSVDTQSEPSDSIVRTLPPQSDDASGDTWARLRLQTLYADWAQEEAPHLFEQQRVQAEVISGE